MKKKVAVYIRVSSEEQTKGESLNTQEKMGIEFAKSNGYEYSVFKDEGLSGGEITRRDGYNDLLNKVKGKQIDILWVFSTSRLNRDVMNQAVLMFECNKLGIPVYVGNKKYDFSNPDDKLQFGFLALMDEYQRNQIARNSTASKMRLIKEGKWVNGTLPFGYSRGENNIGLVVCEEEKVILNKIIDWIIEGATLRLVVQKLRLEHGTVGGRSYRYNGQWVRKLLERDYYVSGLIRLKILDVEQEFKIEPIVTAGRREQAYNVWKRKQKIKREKQVSFLETKIKCEQCGGNVTLGLTLGWKRLDGSRKKYYYWSCRRDDRSIHRKNHWSIPKEEVEYDLLRYIDKFFLSQKFIKEEILEHVVEKYEKRWKDLDEGSLKKVRKDIKTLETRLEKLRYLFTYDDMSIGEYEEQKRETSEKLMKLRRQIEEYDYLEEEKLRLIAEYWLEQLNVESMTAKEFFNNYVEAVYMRVVKRKWFEKGRLIKYRFVFKSVGKSGKGKKGKGESGVHEDETIMSKAILNTTKVVFDKRLELYGLMVLVVWDGFEYRLEDVDFGIY